jgi:hypothetical protein
MHLLSVCMLTCLRNCTGQGLDIPSGENDAEYELDMR